MSGKSLYILSSGFALSTLNYKFASTLVESALQIHPFLTNKANFPKSQMNVTCCLTMNYEQRTMSYEIKNKANSNPIQTQYKANSKPIQSQFKPNSNPIYPAVASGEAGTNPILRANYKQMTNQSLTELLSDPPSLLLPPGSMESISLCRNRTCGVKESLRVLAREFLNHNEHVFLDLKPGVCFSSAFVGFRGSQIIRLERPIAANDDTVPRNFDNEDLACAFVLAKMLSCFFVINHFLYDVAAYLYAGPSCIKYNPYISRGKHSHAADFNYRH